MTSETPLNDLIKIYKNNNDDRVLYSILEFIAGHLNYLNDQLDIAKGANPNDGLLKQMHAEITSLTKFKTDIAAAIQGVWEVVSGFQPNHGMKLEAFSTLESIKDWVKMVKAGTIQIKRR